MKKIIVGIFALALLLGANSVKAAWNNIPADCPNALAIGNYTTGDGIRNGPNGCWTLTSVSGSQGQVINIDIFYDNTNGQDANNTVIHLTQTPPGNITTTSSTYQFSGNLTSSAGNLALSQVTANLTSSQSLTFGQARIYRQGSSSGSTLPNGQSGYEAFQGGLNLGTIPKDDWGNIVMSFAISTNGGGGGGGTNCTISNFTGNGSTNPSVSSGGSVNLAWATNGCTSATVTGPNGNTISTNLSGSATVNPTSSGTYTLSATGTNGTITRTIYVTVTNTESCYINNFTANGSTSLSINSGDNVNYNWSTTGCTSATLTSPNGNTLSTNLSGTYANNPTSSGTYTLTAYGNSGGTQTRTIYITVNNNTPTNTCYINYFTGNGSTSPTITSGDALNLSWSTNGCSSVTVSGVGIYSNVSSDSRTVFPTYSTQYTLSAYGTNGGYQTRTVYVNVNSVINPPILPVITNCAVTTVATNVTQTSAILNGLISSGSGVSYFEYGTTVNLGTRTISRTGSGAYLESISGLLPNTVYYFQFVSQCANGTISRGAIQVFRTLAIPTTTTTNTTTVVTRPVVVQGTTIIGTSSPIMLRIENRYQFIGIGDTVDYTIYYKNIGSQLLTNPIVQVVLPKGITLTNSSAGTYSLDTNTLTVPIMDLKPGDEGVIYAQGVVNLLGSDTAQVVTTAILVYTNPNGAQENAIAYVLNNPRLIAGNTLGASAFFLGIFPTTFLGWLLLLLLILLIVLLTRRYYRKTVQVHSPTGTTTTTTHY